MYIKIDENDFGNHFYDRFLTVNGVIKEFSESEYELTFEEEFEDEELEVIIHFQNRILSKGNKHWLGTALLEKVDRWIFERDFLERKGWMCKPYDALLTFTCKNTDRITLYTNDFNQDQPFVFYKLVPEVCENLFFADKEVKKRWVITQMVPKCIGFSLIVAGFMIYFVTGSKAGKIIMSFPLIFFLLYSIIAIGYMIRLLCRH